MWPNFGRTRSSTTDHLSSTLRRRRLLGSGHLDFRLTHSLDFSPNIHGSTLTSLRTPRGLTSLETSGGRPKT